MSLDYIWQSAFKIIKIYVMQATKSNVIKYYGKEYYDVWKDALLLDERLHIMLVDENKYALECRFIEINKHTINHWEDEKHLVFFMRDVLTEKYYG